MTVKQWLMNAKDSLINYEFMEAIYRFYKIELDEMAAAIFSYSYNGFRLEADSFVSVLSLDEILLSEDCISRDFGTKKILPLIDLADGNYICYFSDLFVWGCYNIVEQTGYSRFSRMEDVLVSIGLLSN